MRVGEDAVKSEPLFTVGGNVNCYGEQYRGFSKIKNRATIRSAITFLSTYSKELKSGP